MSDCFSFFFSPALQGFVVLWVIPSEFPVSLRLWRAVIQISAVIPDVEFLLDKMTLILAGLSHSASDRKSFSSYVIPAVPSGSTPIRSNVRKAQPDPASRGCGSHQDVKKHPQKDCPACEAECRVCQKNDFRQRNVAVEKGPGTFPRLKERNEGRLCIFLSDVKSD